MQLICKTAPTPTVRLVRRRRRALTLLELIIVLVILVTLSGMVVPMIEGLGYQTNASTNATVVNDVNRAVEAYAARHERMPSGWDSLIDTSGNLFDKLHSRLTADAILTTTALTETQAQSLTSAGIYRVYDATVGGPPNSSFIPPPPPQDDEEEEFVNVKSDKTLAILTAASKAGAFNSSQLSLSQLQFTEQVERDNDFVVLGLGGHASIRGTMMRDVPLISSADPSNNYARILCVFMVPNGTTGAFFPARYIGCFLPDGTSQRMNLENFNNLRDGN